MCKLLLERIEMNSRPVYVWKEGMVLGTPQIKLYAFKFVNRNEMQIPMEKLLWISQGWGKKPIFLTKQMIMEMTKAPADGWNVKPK